MNASNFLRRRGQIYKISSMQGYNLRALIGAALLFIFSNIICTSISCNQENIARVKYSETMASSRNPNIPTLAEVNALLEFKANYVTKGTQHRLWTWNSSSIPTICESWVGITCTTRTPAGAHGHVLKISLPNFGLAGSLAPHLGNLSFLSMLNLSGNHFTSTIPSQLEGCTSLTRLDLNFNSLTGTIPSSLGALSSLQVLELGANHLSGPIPPTLLSNCTSLKALSLTRNALTGSIVPIDLIRGLHLPSLMLLYLSENNFTGAIPPSLGNCTSLVAIQLLDNQLTGAVPSEIGFLSHLDTLYMHANNLTGSIPPSLGNCTSLVDLDISSNQLTGAIPSGLGFLNQVESIRLFYNGLTGAIPPSLGNCTNLSNLQLSGNQLIAIPAELALLSHLQVLLLDRNKLKGSILPNLAICTNLTELDLSHNQLTGPVPAELSQLLHLQGLSLGNNMLSGEIPWNSLTNATSLFYLGLYNNYLSGGFPSTLGRLAGLKYLYLQGNLLQGGIPVSANYTALTLLDVSLSFNELNGSLPSRVVPAFRTLALSLDLSHNQFSGSLPIWLGQLVQVQTIDLSNNNFIGSIPESLGNCANLLTLNLSENHLSGDLPLQLGDATNLNSLDLSNNNFSGILPSYLGTALRYLQFLNVSFNNLTGPIPTHAGVFNHLNASSYIGNPGLCGPILKRECPDLQSSKEHDGHRHHHSPWHLTNWRGVLLMAFILLILLSIVLLLIGWCYCFLQHGKVIGNNFIGKLAGTTRYSEKELMEATQGYSQDNLLGEGGLSVVYKGVLTSGKIVAIKKMKDAYNGSREALLREMLIMRKLRHRNLVQVLGCVLNLDVKALVLEYMENGSLECYLNMQHEQINVAGEETDSCGLSYWEVMTRIAISVAKALSYLHHEYDVPIIHGDVKPSNILFDSNMEPHLADLGLAKLINRGHEAITLTADFKGSIGYMAPEYVLATRITTKVDVYAYGVVLLRMLTGRRPTQVVPSGLSLHEWVKSKLPSNDYTIPNTQEVLDASLVQNPTYNHHFVISLLRIGLACTTDHPKGRPTIKEVLRFLTST